MLQQLKAQLVFSVLVGICSPGFSQSDTLSKRFFSKDTVLQQQVESVFNSLSEQSVVAQLIMPAVGRYGMSADSIKLLIKNQRIGGVLLLNGTKAEFKKWTHEFDSLNRKADNLPFLYSADAEPSLVNRKMLGSTPVKKAVEIESEDDVRETAKVISKDLTDVGINYNFAPVVDVAANKTVGYRGFGAKPENIIPFSKAFIEVTQNSGIVATAKHFPGHGLVSGDTHKSLQIIDGELKELSNYPPLIEAGVLSVMIAHIAVRNNAEFETHGMPATTSRKIVTDLLRDSLGFEGLIVTDAMNMGGVVHTPDAYRKAIAAGCDILLMPVDPIKAHEDLLASYRSDLQFKAQIDASAKRIIRMKICLGLL